MDISLGGIGTYYVDMIVTDPGIVYCAGWFDATAAGQGYKNIIVQYDQAMNVLNTWQFSVGGSSALYDQLTKIDKHYLWDYIYGVGT